MGLLRDLASGLAQQGPGRNSQAQNGFQGPSYTQNLGNTPYPQYNDNGNYGLAPYGQGSSYGAQIGYGQQNLRSGPNHAYGQNGEYDYPDNGRGRYSPYGQGMAPSHSSYDRQQTLSPSDSIYRSTSNPRPRLPPRRGQLSPPLSPLDSDRKGAPPTYSRSDNVDSRGSVSYPEHNDGLSRPIALPKIDFGDGAPFLRGYCSELESLGISQRDFIRFVDAVNIAEVPNPEVAIANKAMGLASWFVPGVGGTLLNVGQIGAQVGGAMQHKSATGNRLAAANKELFNPVGLEVVICSSHDLNNMIGFCPQPLGGPPWNNLQSAQGGLMGSSAAGTGWLTRLQSYGYGVASIDATLPALQAYGGRNDLSAQFAHGISDRNQKKAQEKAVKDMQEGKNGGLDKREKSFKWLVIRNAVGY